MFGSGEEAAIGESDIEIDVETSGLWECTGPPIGLKLVFEPISLSIVMTAFADDFFENVFEFANRVKVFHKLFSQLAKSLQQQELIAVAPVGLAGDEDSS